MKTLAYIFGQPGSGKTTLMTALCSDATKFYEADSPIKHRAMRRDGELFTVLGADAKPFGGTDTLSYTAAARASEWLAELAECKAGKTIIAEGDRLATSKFFEQARKFYRVVLFYLDCDDKTAQQRREQRAKDYKLDMQSPSWVKGRVTKHKNTAKRERGVVALDAAEDPLILASKVWEAIHGQTRTTT